MYTVRKNRNSQRLAASDNFVAESQHQTAEFAVRSAQQQVQFKAVNNAGIAMARAKADAQRQQELRFAYDTLNQSVAGLVENFAEIERLHKVLHKN